MSIKRHILKAFNYYSKEYIISVIAFMLTYLTVFLMFSFSSIVNQKALDSFNSVFENADFIFSSEKGIRFDKSGSLLTTSTLDSKYQKKIIKFLITENIKYITVKDSLLEGVAYILAFQNRNAEKLFKFCKGQNILVLSSYNAENAQSKSLVIMYDVNGLKNRFNVFSFQNQIAASTLNKEFSSIIGKLSRMLFAFSLIFTFYLSILFFKEKQVIYRVLLLQGYTDLSLKFIFIENFFVNLLAIIISVVSLVLILFLSGINISFAILGLLYALPYLPVLLFLQVLVQFNRVLKYLQDE